MNFDTQACIGFEQDIHAFVDHELQGAEMTRVVDHLDDCNRCRRYMDDLRQLASVHVGAANDMDRAMADVVDRHALFGGITRALLDEKREELARLFFELGKAYVLKANRALERAENANHHERGKRNHSALFTRPRPIRTTTDKARRVARECERLAEHAAGGARRTIPRSGSLFGRRSDLFDMPSGPGAGALGNGRRYLEQSLEIRADHAPTRLHLGFLHMLCGRYDRARREFRHVHRHTTDPVHRMMALQWLGAVFAALGHEYSSRDHYLRAIECYEAVVESGVVDREPRLFVAYLNLGVNCAKIGMLGRAVKHFTQLVELFPSRVAQSRKLLARKADFSALLSDSAVLRNDLELAVPALFATTCGEE